MTTSAHVETRPERARRDDLTRRLDDIGWGLFLLVTGAFWIFGEHLPDGTWLTSVGVLLLALNAVRHRMGIHLSVVTLILGALALAGGLAELTHVRLPLLELSFVSVGIYLVIKAFMGRASG